MAVKYKQTYKDMLKQHKELFDSFREIHDKFKEDPDVHKEQFNEIGMKVMEIVRRFETQLTSQSIGSGYGRFSTNLSDKFRDEIRKDFPKIDFIGIK